MARVLIAGFCAVPASDRSGVQMGHVLDALVEHHTVDVLVSRRGDQAYVERYGTGRILRVPLHDDALRSQVEAFRRALRRQLEGAEYDVVQFRDGWAGIPVLEQRERLGYAAVFDTARSPLAEPQILPLDLSTELQRDHEACVLGADMVLAATEPARRFLTARGRPERVFTVPVGVNVDRFDWDYPPSSGPPRILMIGTVEPGRGVRVLLRAMADVAVRSRARLTIAGPISAQFAETLRKGVADLGLGGRVELLGPVDPKKIPELIASSTVCVAPAAVELTPRPLGVYPTKVLEYMACRRPVVAPRRGTVTMIMKDGVHGLLFTPGDPTDLARALLTLLARPELRQRLADSGYDMVRRQHTASATRRNLRYAYETLASRSPWRERFSEVATDPTAPPMQMIEPSGELEVTDFDAEPAPRAATVTAPGDVTRVDTRGREPDDEVDSGEWQTMATRPVRAATDDWMVTEPHHALSDEPRAARPEDEGTPVDVSPARPPTAPLENRFVAGEVDVPAPPDESEETNFTAVSVLLGGDDATPGPEHAPDPADVADDDPTPPPERSGGRRRRARATEEDPVPPPPGPRQR